MRRNIRTLSLVSLLIIILFLPVFSHAEHTDLNYSSGDVINEDITISNGDSIHLSGIVSIANDVTINIEAGGILNVSGTMSATTYGATLLPYDTNVSIYIPNVVTSGTKLVEITFNLESEEESGPEIFWNGNNESIVNQSSHLISTSFTAGDDPLLVNLLGKNIFGTKLLSISISVDDTEVLNNTPWFFEQEGLKPYSSRNWNLENNGTINLVNSEIIGAKISGSGTFNAINSHYNLSSPILLSASSIFNIEGGGMDGSETDEYIEGPWGMTIQWDNTTNSGDSDRWIKTLDCQKILLPSSDSFVVVKNLQYMNSGVYVDRQGFANQNSEFEFVGMCDTGWRMVEIVDSEGVIWMEDAYIETAWWNSAWGNFSTSNIPLGFEQVVEIQLDIPDVNVKSIELNKNESIVNEPIEVTITLENTGNVSAMVPIECKLSDGSDADVSPFGQTVIIAGGETGVVLVDWRNNKDGEESLTCQPLKPSGFEDSELLGGNSATSEVVTWDELMDSSETTTSTIIVLVVLIGGVVGLVTYLKNTAQNTAPGGTYNQEEKIDPMENES